MLLKDLVQLPLALTISELHCSFQLAISALAAALGACKPGKLRLLV